MLNNNYLPEIIMAQNFLNEHKDDLGLRELMWRAQVRDLSHSYRWSMIYDYITKHFPNEPSKLITGLTYYCEG